VDTLRLRYAPVILGLATAFYCLASIVIGRMPFTWTPAWWMGIWPSRKVAVYLWFGTLNAVGAVISAIPVSLLLRWLVEDNRIRAALTVGVPKAVLTIGSVIAHYSPLSLASTLMAVELYVVVLLSVPLLVWVMGALASKRGFQRSPE
jgi:fluoride ion exporter CrcB/FEX